jgi:metal-sulfur cluster biosynthetic enzyme
MPEGPSVPSEDDVRERLRVVNDPEVGINIVDLGLVYGVEVSPERIRIRLTMTSPACPLGDLVIDEARQAVSAILPRGTHLDVELVWDPPWSPERMTESAKKMLGWSG